MGLVRTRNNFTSPRVTSNTDNEHVLKKGHYISMVF